MKLARLDLGPTDAGVGLSRETAAKVAVALLNVVQPGMGNTLLGIGPTLDITLATLEQWKAATGCSCPAEFRLKGAKQTFVPPESWGDAAKQNDSQGAKH